MGVQRDAIVRREDVLQALTADDQTHAFFTRLMDEGGAMLWWSVT